MHTSFENDNLKINLDIQPYPIYLYKIKCDDKININNNICISVRIFYEYLF